MVIIFSSQNTSYNIWILILTLVPWSEADAEFSSLKHYLHLLLDRSVISVILTGDFMNKCKIYSIYFLQMYFILPVALGLCMFMA